MDHVIDGDAGETKQESGGGEDNAGVMDSDAGDAEQESGGGKDDAEGEMRQEDGG